MAEASELAGLEPTELAELLGLPAHVALGEPIHTSATGAIWRGRDRRVGVDVVVKVLEPAHRGRLEAESRAMARLGEHPNILGAAIVGHGADGTAWVVSEQLDATLAEAAPRVPVREVLSWAAQVAEALLHVHEMGVVHGDLSPTNVLIDGDGRARLADFGSARIEGDSHGDIPSGHTPRYASPERRRGRPATPESDVYGYGATVLAVLPDGRAGVPRRVRRLLAACVRTDPAGRPDAERVARVMSRR